MHANRIKAIIGTPAARRTLTAAACASFALGVATSGAASAGTGFVGSWSATDHDGSNLSLSIQGGGAGHYAVREFDDTATVCGGAPAQVVGAGTADGDFLGVPVALSCLPSGNVFRQRVFISFTYDANSDTITDDTGVIWTRTG
jgi:hypothetical protein